MVELGELQRGIRIGKGPGTSGAYSMGDKNEVKMAFNFNWKNANQRPANPDPDMVDMGQAAPYAQVPPTTVPVGYRPDPMNGYRPNDAMTDGRGLVTDNVAYREPYQNSGAYSPDIGASYDENIRQTQLEEIDARILANNAKIAELERQLVKAGESSRRADELDRRLAMNRVKANDYGNAQAHLGRIEARDLAARQREALQRLQESKGRDEGIYYNDLLDVARAKADAAALKDDPNLASEAEAIYNIKREQFKQKHGEEPDFSRYTAKNGTDGNRAAYVTGESLGTSKELTNFTENRTGKYRGRDVWTGTEEERKNAAASAREQYDEAEAKRIEQMPTKAKVDRDIADHKAKVDALTAEVKQAVATLSGMAGTPAQVRRAYDDLPDKVKKNIDLKNDKGRLVFTVVKDIKL